MAHAPLEGLVTVPGGVHWRQGGVASPYLSGFRSLFASLPDDVHLTVVAGKSAIASIDRWPEIGDRPSKPLYVPVDDDLELSFWCQDEFLAAVDQDDGAPAVILSASPKRGEDAEAATEVARVLGMKTSFSEAVFEGGNVLVGDDFVLVGEDSRAGLAGAALDEGRVVHFVGTGSPVLRRHVSLVEEDERTVLVESFGGTGRRQPVFHLDAFLSLAGRGSDGRQKILVGDPRAACELCLISASFAGAPSLFDAFDEVAHSFAKRPEFDVIRNPLPIIYSEDSGFLAWSRRSIEREFAGAGGLDDALGEMDRCGLTRVAVRRWYFATQNSAIVIDGRHGQRSVLLPTYAHGKWKCLAPAERRNAEIWNSLGFRVIELGDFNAFAQRHGSAHCIFKVMAPPTRPAL